jgi:hypothetical protein
MLVTVDEVTAAGRAEALGLGPVSFLNQPDNEDFGFAACTVAIFCSSVASFASDFAVVLLRAFA